MKSVTVFVISVGNINYEDCITALKKQSVEVNINIIKNYYPMSNAFQQMLDRCETDLFIQVDEDMILSSNAIETMVHNFNEDVLPDTVNYLLNSNGDLMSSDNCNQQRVMDCYLLKDVHLDKKIYGVKIYNARVFKNYPYNQSHPSCEVEQLDRMWKDGYYYRFCYQLMGLHSPKWTNSGIFERYYNLFNKYKIYKYEWIRKLLPYLKDKYEKEPNDINFNALAGALCAIYEEKTMETEKNALNINEGYRKLYEYL